VLDFRIYQALTFDCYGTLIDWESGLLPILERWAERNAVSLRGDQLLEAFAETESQLEREGPRTLYPDILRGVVRTMAVKAGAPRDENAEDELAQSAGEWPAFPDSADALRALKRYYKLAILSNVDRNSFAASNRRLGVAFDLVVTAQDVGSYKPELRNFEVLLGRLGDLGVASNRVLHVAQSLYHDHAPAKQLGIATVWINRRQAKTGHGATMPPRTPVTPDEEYPSMQAFAAAVEAAFTNAGRQ